MSLKQATNDIENDSSQCIRCQCNNESLEYWDVCISCRDEYDDESSSIMNKKLCEKCAQQDIVQLDHIKCPHCDKAIHYTENDDDEQKRKKIKRGSFLDYLKSYKICQNPPEMTDIIHINERELIETAAFIVYERRGTMEGLFNDFQTFEHLIGYSECVNINGWFVSKLTSDTYHLITPTIDKPTLRELIAKAEVQTFVKGNSRTAHVFTVLEKLNKVDTEFHDSIVSQATKLRLLFSKENLDGPLLNDLFVLCKKQVGFAKGNISRSREKDKRNSFVLLHSILLKFSCIIQDNAQNRGITISSDPIVLSPASTKLYLICPSFIPGTTFNFSEQIGRVKSLGAKFDWNVRMWYINMAQDITPFQQWL